MKTLGYLLIAAGFLGGAYVAVLTVEGIDWPRFLPWLVAGLVGVVLVQIGIRRGTRSAGVVTANVEALTAALDRLDASARRLDEEKAELDPYRVRHVIDERFLADLDTFVEARETIAHRWGLQTYADVMSHFATAERYLNRAWSASTDGYVDEVHTSLGRAREEFAEAKAMLGRAAAAG
jgi:hypothetical protein